MRRVWVWVAVAGVAAGLTACGADERGDRDATGGSDAGGDGDAGVDSGPDLCELTQCFDICGAQVPVWQGELSAAYVAVASRVPVRPWFATSLDGVTLTSALGQTTVRDAAGTVLGTVDVGDSSGGLLSTSVGFVGPHILDLRVPGAPRIAATWGVAPLGVVELDGARWVVLDVGASTALVAVGTDGIPIVERCHESPRAGFEGAWSIAVTGRWQVAAGVTNLDDAAGARVRALHLETGALIQAQGEWEGMFAAVGERLWASLDGTTGWYDLTESGFVAASREIPSPDGRWHVVGDRWVLTATQALDFGAGSDREPGGMVRAWTPGYGDDGPDRFEVACRVDLTDPTAIDAEVPNDPGTGSGEGSGEGPGEGSGEGSGNGSGGGSGEGGDLPTGAQVLLPNTVGATPFAAADAPPPACGYTGIPTLQPTAYTPAPDGASVYVAHGDRGLVWTAEGSGSGTAADAPPSATDTWWTQRGFVAQLDTGGDWGMPVTSTFAFWDGLLVALAPAATLVTAGAAHAVEVDATGLWVVSENAARVYEDPVPPPEEWIAWRADATAGVPEAVRLDVPAGFAPVDIAADGVGNAWVFGARGEIRRFGPDGSESGLTSLPPRLDTVDAMTSRAAGPMGLLIAGAGGAWWYDPNGIRRTVDGGEGIGAVVGAHAQGFWVTMARAEVEQWDERAPQQTVLVEPISDGDGVVLVPRAAIPGAWSVRGFGGRALVGHSAVLVSPPDGE